MQEALILHAGFCSAVQLLNDNSGATAVRQKAASLVPDDLGAKSQTLRDGLRRKSGLTLRGP